MWWYKRPTSCYPHLNPPPPTPSPVSMLQEWIREVRLLVVEPIKNRTPDATTVLALGVVRTLL